MVYTWVHQALTIFVHAPPKCKANDSCNKPSLDYRNCVSVTSQIKIACFTTVIHALMNLLLETSLATFIAKSQSNFFKKQKDTLNQIDCILVLDFAENYSCYPGL